MKQLTIELSDEVFHYLEVRAAIDDMRIKQAVEEFLSALVTARKERRPILFNDEVWT